MAKFLITGGAGFIGSNIAEHLIREGHFVRVLDNFYTGREENLNFAKELGSDTFELIRGDIRDPKACTQACGGMDYVLHQAAMRSVPKSLEDPLIYNDVNINGILTMLQAAAQNNIKRFVFASSSSVYGTSEQIPQVETQLPALISPYALTKLAGEYYCRIFSEQFNLKTACLRYFNVFGPKQALDDEYAVVIPKFIHCILHDESPPIFGNGKQSRDFTYIENVISANILAATAKGFDHEVFNVANGHDNSVLELVALLNKIIGKSIKPQHFDIRKGDIFRTLADISKIQTTIHYQPLVDFQEGLRRTVDYFTSITNK